VAAVERARERQKDDLMVVGFLLIVAVGIFLG